MIERSPRWLPVRLGVARRRDPIRQPGSGIQLARELGNRNLEAAAARPGGADQCARPAGRRRVRLPGH
eukprot:766874-Hanusia_phi.AAC.3